jgi:hypothetical protein
VVICTSSFRRRRVSTTSTSSSREIIIRVAFITDGQRPFDDAVNGYAFDDHLLPEERLVDEHLACLHGLVDADAAGLHAACLDVECLGHDGQHQGRLAGIDARVPLQVGQRHGHSIAALLLSGQHLEWHQHLLAAFERHQHLGPAAVQGPSGRINGAVDPLGVRHRDGCWWVHACPFLIGAPRRATSTS